MLDRGPESASTAIRIIAATSDSEFERMLTETFGSNAQIDLKIVAGGLVGRDARSDFAGANVIVIDLDASRQDEVVALQTFATKLGGSPPIIVVTQAFSGADRGTAFGDQPGQSSALQQIAADKIEPHRLPEFVERP